MRKDERRDSKNVQLGQMIVWGEGEDKHQQGLYLKNVAIKKGQTYPQHKLIEVNFSSATPGINLATRERRVLKRNRRGYNCESHGGEMEQKREH